MKIGMLNTTLTSRIKWDAAGYKMTDGKTCRYIKDAVTRIQHRCVIRETGPIGFISESLKAR